MNTLEPAVYARILSALSPLLYDLPGKLISIDGRPGVGKTTLGRFLAWKFNISLIETDLFLLPHQGEYVYRDQDILRLVDRRLSIPRPVIVDGVAVQRTLQIIGRRADFKIYVETSDLDLDPEDNQDLLSYEAAFAPRSGADLVVQIPSF